MFLQRKEDNFEPRWIAAGLYSENAVSNKIRYRVSTKAQNMQPVTLWTYHAPQGDRKKPLLFQNVI